LLLCSDDALAAGFAQAATAWAAFHNTIEMPAVLLRVGWSGLRCLQPTTTQRWPTEAERLFRILFQFLRNVASQAKFNADRE
jgi:hypothetical protein